MAFSTELRPAALYLGTVTLFFYGVSFIVSAINETEVRVLIGAPLNQPVSVSGKATFDEMELN
jgi:hypothetical protein